MPNFPNTIFDFITTEEREYQTREIQVSDNVSWNMSRHLMMSFNFKHGWFTQASNEYGTKPPFKNIIAQILEFRYAAEDRDVKDIVFYVEDPEKHHLSFLIKKYFEEVFTVENDIDSFLDDAIEQKIDYGGCLIKKGLKAVPEVVELREIAFCDQTGILNGPIGFKFNFSPDNLRIKAKQGWGDKANGADITLDELILLAKQEKDPPTSQGQGNQNQTTGKNIEVYVVRGQMPSAYLKGNDMEQFINQVQIVAFYQTQKGKKGVTLFKNKETEDIFKFHAPKKLFNRALGRGTVEELFDAQLWTNFAEKYKTDMLKAASKVIFWTDDDGYANRNKIKNLDNLEITTVAKDSRGIAQIPTGSPNINLFTQSLVEWENHAKEIGGATDPLLGKQPPAGTPFRLQERVVFEGKKPHERRAGKFDKFLEEIIKEWILPHITKEIVKGKKFLATLSFDDMQFVSERVAENRANYARNEDVLSGRIPEDREILKQRFLGEFMKGGNKKPIEILKEELSGIELKVKIDISGKQKDLTQLTDKLVNILRQYLSTPQLRQDPVALKLLNRILEASGISPIDFGGVLPAMPPNQQEAGGAMQATRPIGGLIKREATMA